MAQQIQELIDKIRSEGVQHAQQEKQNIVSSAKEEAERIISEACAQAKQIISDGQDETKRMKDSATMALQQSARNMLLSLRRDIQNMLQSIIATEVKDVLTPENLNVVIDSAIQSYLNANQVEGGVKVTVSEADLKNLNDGFVAKLKKKLKDPVEFRPSADVAKGFVVSFDNGKSNFDFTDEALAEYLSTYLNDGVAKLLKESVSN